MSSSSDNYEVLSASKVELSSTTNRECPVEDFDVVELIPRKKSITIIDAFAIVFGTIVGSGVFMGVQEPYLVFDSHSMLFVTLFWLGFGIIIIFGGLCYAELGTRIPESGGDCTYLKKIISPKVSLTFIIFYAFVIKTLTLSALSITTSIYILKIFVQNPLNHYFLLRLVAMSIIFICFLLNYFSKFLATKAGVVTTATKTIAILIIVISGIVFLGKGNTEGWDNSIELRGFSLKQLGGAFLAVFWAYDGGNTLGMVAGDMVNPARDLPLAIIFGMGLVVFLYVMIVISYPAIIGFENARTSSGVAYDCAVKIMGRFAPIMSILICSSSFGSANSMIFSVSSAMASAANSGELPKVFALVNRKSRTYVFSSFVISVIGIFGTFLDFNTILGYVSLSALIFYSLTYISLWLIKLENPCQGKIFQVPYFLIVPIQLVSVLIIALSIQTSPIGSFVLITLLLSTFLVQFIKIPRENKFYRSVLLKQDQFIEICEKYLYLDMATSSDIS